METTPKSRFKKLLKRKLFWFVFIVIILIITGIIYSSLKPVKEELVTSQAIMGNLIQTVSATGKIESASETELNFTVSGKLGRLNVEAGQEVKAGHLLAQLASSQVASQVTAAQAQVAEAQADLDRVIAGASNEDIFVSQSAVASAQSALEAAEIDLANAEASRDQGILNLKNDLLDTVSDSIFNSKESLNEVDDILTSTHQDYLGNINRGTFYQAESQYALTQNIVNSLDGSYTQYSIEDSDEELIDLAEQTLNVLWSVDDLLDDTYDMLIKTQALGSLTQTILDGYKADIGTEQASMAAKISAVQTDKSDLETDTLDLENDVEQARSDLELKEAELALKEAELALKEADPRNFEINLYQARLLSAQAKLQSAIADLADYSLRAPIDGLITKVNYEIGEYVSSAEALLSLIGGSNLEITTDVPESDIAKIKVADEVEITLDAFGDELVFPGHISFIDPAETIINDVVYYQVKVTFDQQEEEVKPGMTANVTVLTANRENVIYIPARAVIEKDGQRIVRVLTDGQKQEKEVTTGLRADDGLIEILSGLNEGETVITFIKNGN